MLTFISTLWSFQPNLIVIQHGKTEFILCVCVCVYTCKFIYDCLSSSGVREHRLESSEEVTAEREQGILGEEQVRAENKSAYMPNIKSVTGVLIRSVRRDSIKCK